ncbi:MAG: lamin tail domain-containing protein [Paludibacter sp.]
MIKSTNNIAFPAIVILLLFLNITISAQNIRISEIMAANDSVLTDEDGEYSDWIELHNYSGNDIYLGGWTLTDEVYFPYKWMFPDITIKAGEYLVVFASGKNRRVTGKALHTNFNLKASGEYLALINPSGSIITEFKPAFPAQIENTSYGYFNDRYIWFKPATPGSNNALSTGKILPVPEFSKSHGFYDAAFQLSLSTGYSADSVYYTTDGSLPSKTNGTLYKTPINISTTSIIRAATVKTGYGTGKTATQSYLFVNDIIRQSNTPAGYPTTWGPYTAITGNAEADYEMDQELLGTATFATTVKSALKEIPTISIVTNKDNFFSTPTDPVTGGIYMYTGAPITNTTYATGRDWERPVSVEYIANDTSLQIDCGIRIQGGHGRRPEKSPKHSFLLVFERKYGPNKLQFPGLFKNGVDGFENIILRAGFGNSWVHQDGAARTRATYQEDIWTKDTQRAMGHKAGNSIFAHVYINGIYWGMYAPSERMDKEFAEAHIGGDEDDWDVIKDYAEVSDGTIDAWNKMMTMANNGLETTEKYMAIQGKNADGTPNYTIESMVDVENLIDYMLINFYGGNSDWDNHNWSAMRSRVTPDKGFRFLCWDGEMMFTSLNTNVLSENNENCPSRVYQQLLKNSTFKHLLANRIQKHCFNNGLLTPDSLKARWNTRKAQIENAINCEASRWGDYRRDVHTWQSAPYNLYTKDSWTTQQNYLANTFFMQRTGILVSQFQTAGIFPTINAPVYKINNAVNYNKYIASGAKLSLTATNGTIYYTLDGTDPLNLSTNTVSSGASTYSQQITLSKSVHLIARAYYNGQWSAAVDKFFVIAADLSALKITEIHYHPLNEGLTDDSYFEFIELKNTGTATLDIGGLTFTNGLTYTFPKETQLGAGKFIVLASNSNSFFSRYGFRPFATYKGQLDNSGERITLVSDNGIILTDMSFATYGIWPTSPDGGGYSLVPVALNPANSQVDGTEWRASHKVGGSPGADDLPVSSVEMVQTPNDGRKLMVNSYPNPFSDKTYIDIQTTEMTRVNVAVYDIMGRVVKYICQNHTHTGGLQQFEWNGCDENANMVANGVYFVKVSLNGTNTTQNYSAKLILRR